MAGYQISFIALAPAGTGDAYAVPDRIGMRLAIDNASAGPSAAPGVLLVEDGPQGPTVAPGSPLGQAGQTVTLGHRITTTTQEAAPRLLRFDVLKLDGVAVGLIGAEAPAAGVALEVTALEAPGGPARLRSLADKRPQQQGGKPRKTLFGFTPGTRIDTPDGPRPVETLAAGDLVSTLDNGSQPLRWIGWRSVLPAEMALREDLRPVLFDRDAIGNTAPLLVSPRHRLLLNDWRAQVYFGEDQVLVPAQALINGTSVRQIVPEDGVTFIHLLFDRHEVIVTEGALSESFHPAEAGLAALDPAQRDEIEALFPDNALERRRAAFPMLRMAEARALRLPG